MKLFIVVKRMRKEFQKLNVWNENDRNSNTVAMEG